MDDKFRPTSRRQRLVILAVAVGTVLLLWFLLIWRPGGHYPVYPIAEQPACKPGQTTGCVGGQANVMLIPAQPASVAPAGTASAPGAR